MQGLLDCTGPWITYDCLHNLGAGKLKTERMVPVDSFDCAAAMPKIVWMFRAHDPRRLRPVRKALSHSVS